MMWSIPFLLWLGLTGLIVWRDIPRITQHLENTYDFTATVSRKYAKLIANLIYLPVFGIMAAGLWLGEIHSLGELGVCVLWIVGLAWFFLGYTFTGGRQKNDTV